MIILGIHVEYASLDHVYICYFLDDRLCVSGQGDPDPDRDKHTAIGQRK